MKPDSTTTDSPGSQETNSRIALTLPCRVAPLIPHSRGMCLLDTLLTVHDSGGEAEVLTRRDDLFAEPAGIPAYVGVEWLAQAVAAWAGWCHRDSDAKPAPGLLLGSKRYRSRVAYFPFECRIRVVIDIDFVADNGVTQVKGALYAADDDTPLAEGSLTLYHPESMPGIS